VAVLPHNGVGLRLRLQHIAAVGEDGRAIGQHDRQAGAAGEPGEPSQAFGRWGDVFAEMLVGAGDEEAVQAGTGEFGPKGGEPITGGGHGAYLCVFGGQFGFSCISCMSEC
jgi:hypothetical protein